MNRHATRILLLVLAAIIVFASSMAFGHYGLGVFVIMATVIGLLGYFIGMAHIPNRPDNRPEGERQHDPPL